MWFNFFLCIDFILIIGNKLFVLYDMLIIDYSLYLTTHFRSKYQIL